MSFVREALARVRFVRPMSGGLLDAKVKATLVGDSREKDRAPKAWNNCWVLVFVVLAAALAFGLFGDKTESRAALAPHCTKWPLGALSLPKHFTVGLKTPSLEHSLVSRSRSHEPQFGDALFGLLCALIAAIGCRKALMRWSLFALSLTTLFPLGTALNCVMDVSLFDDYETAQCDVGCDSCKFIQNSGVFKYGTLKCSPNVPCSVEVHANMRYSTIIGTAATVLSLELFDGADMDYSTVYAPDGGDFSFESTDTQAAVYRTIFHVENSKVVDITIYDDHVDNVNQPEMYSMSVYASNADELKILLGSNTLYAKYVDSRIECPEFGLCQWTSFGKRYDDNVDYMKVVDVIAFPTTELRVLCGNNAETCDGVIVDCQNDTCPLQFTTTSNTWVCYSDCDFEIENFAITTTQEPESNSKSSNDSILLVALGLAAALLVFCLGAAFYYKYVYAKGKGASKQPPAQIVEFAETHIAEETMDRRWTQPVAEEKTVTLATEMPPFADRRKDAIGDVVTSAPEYFSSQPRADAFEGGADNEGALETREFRTDELVEPMRAAVALNADGVGMEMGMGLFNGIGDAGMGGLHMGVPLAAASASPLDGSEVMAASALDVKLPMTAPPREDSIGCEGADATDIEVAEAAPQCFALPSADAVDYGVSDAQVADGKTEGDEVTGDMDADKEFVDWFHATFKAQFHKYLLPLLEIGFDSVETLALMDADDVSAVTDKIPRGHCKLMIKKAVAQQSIGHPSPARHHTTSAGEGDDDGEAMLF